MATATEQITAMLEHLATAADCASNLDDPDSLAGNQETILTAVGGVQETLEEIRETLAACRNHLAVVRRLGFLEPLVERSLAIWLAGWDYLRKTGAYARRAAAFQYEPEGWETERDEREAEG